MNIPGLGQLDWRAGLSTHKRTLILIGVALLLLFIGFVSGRYTKHPEVKTITKVETKTVTQIQWRDKIDTIKNATKDEKKRTHTVVDQLKKPDGTVETKTTTDVDDEDDVKVSVKKEEDKQQSETQVITQSVFKEKLVLQQPNWRLYAGAGVSVPYFLGEHAIGVPGLQGFVIQAGADRRIIGPFWAGVFGNTQGTVGLNLSAVW